MWLIFFWDTHTACFFQVICGVNETDRGEWQAERVRGGAQGIITGSGDGTCPAWRQAGLGIAVCISIPRLSSSSGLPNLAFVLLPEHSLEVVRLGWACLDAGHCGALRANMPRGCPERSAQNLRPVGVRHGDVRRHRVLRRDIVGRIRWAVELQPHRMRRNVTRCQSRLKLC